MKFKIEMKSYFDSDAWGKGVSGIYLLIFPNGMKYVGKSKNIRKRIGQHVKAFCSREPDWHATALETFYKVEREVKYSEEFVSVRIINFDVEKLIKQFWNKVKIYIQTCEEGLKTAYEKQALREIDKNGFREQYYNTQYPKPIKEVDFTGLI